MKSGFYLPIDQITHLPNQEYSSLDKNLSD